MSKHTPGPWVVSERFPDCVMAGKLMVGSVSAIDSCGLRDWEHGQQTMANARLIASAPEMYEVLREIAKNDPHNQSSAGIAARAILAKIEGR